jgi:hypothetical protein
LRRWTSLPDSNRSGVTADQGARRDFHATPQNTFFCLMHRGGGHPQGGSPGVAQRCETVAQRCDLVLLSP